MTKQQALKLFEEKKVRTVWDDEQEKVIEVNSTQYSERIIAPVGKHTLKIEVIDDKGIKTEKTVGVA